MKQVRVIKLLADKRYRPAGAVLALVALVCLAAAGCGKPTGYPPAADGEGVDSTALAFWQSQNPQLSPVRWAQADLDEDSRPDTVVIYRLENNKCQMMIVINRVEGFRLTGPVAAPVSEQKIDFTNFDSRPPEEVVITGTNGSYAGTAIFRLEKEQIVNIFDQDFDKCCRQYQLKAPMLFMF
jgi:hypothetical protein